MSERFSFKESFFVAAARFRFGHLLIFMLFSCCHEAVFFGPDRSSAELPPLLDVEAFFVF
ncbi:hypothetical protein [Paenibacillus sp. PvR053]